MFARSLLLPAVLSGLAACAPYRPPPEPPPLGVARQPVRVLRADAAPPAVAVVVRAGSAYDPPSREGLAFVLAEAIASRAGVAVEVGPEVVIFRAAPGQAAPLAAALAAPISAEALAAGVAAAQARLAATDCAAAAESVVPAWAFAGHPYGHATAGHGVDVGAEVAVTEEQDHGAEQHGEGDEDQDAGDQHVPREDRHSEHGQSWCPQVEDGGNQVDAGEDG